MKIIVCEDGRSFVNADQIVRVFCTDSGVTYETVVGTERGGYSPRIATCNKYHAKSIYYDVLRFLASDENGIYDAAKKCRELQMANVNK